MITEWNESLTRTSVSQINISKNTELHGDVLCRACGYFLGKLERLRHYGDLYFINDDDFCNRIEEKLLPEPEEFPKSSNMGILCQFFLNIHCIYLLR